MFQEHWGLTVTGELDAQTQELMSKRRCGMPDMVTMEDIPSSMMMGNHSNHSRKRRYTLFGGKWPTNDVTYKFLNFPMDYDLSKDEVRQETVRAFKVWEAVSPLRFREANSYERANINIRFVRYYHGDGGAFDGRGGTLAHAYAPTLGDTHFDDDETWTIGTNAGTNYFQVAAHEFGHALGLGHSQYYSALMAPFYPGYQPNFRLHSDDILAIQSRYGLPTGGGKETTTTDSAVTYHPRTTPRPVPSTQRPTPYPRKPSICDDMTLDAITINLEDDKEVVYGFRGNEYFRIHNRGYGIAEGYPRPISSGWQNVPGDLDAALYLDPIKEHKWQWDSDNWKWVWVSKVIRDAKTYLFKDDKVWLFVNSRLQDGYPRAVSTEFPGLPRGYKIDAAFVWTGNGEVYFIIRDQYYRFNVDQNRVDYGYPQPLYHWQGLPKKIDAAIRHTNKWTYVFSGDQYYRLSDSKMEIAIGYPRNSDPYWFQCDKFRGIELQPADGDDTDPSSSATTNYPLATLVLSTVFMILRATLV